MRAISAASATLLLTDGVDEPVPVLAHLGADPGPMADNVVEAISRPTPGETIDPPAPLTPVPDPSRGWTGRPGLAGHRPDGRRIGRLDNGGIRTSDAGVTIVLVGEGVTVEVTYEAGATLRCRAVVTNTSDTPLALDHLDITLPLPDDHAELLTFEGRWAHEFSPVRQAWPSGIVERTSREGRPSHDHAPAVFAGTPGFTDETGSVVGAQLAWSGNHRVRVERLTDGRRVLQVGELLEPGEVVLARDEAYRSPDVVVATSTTGTNAISQAFHRVARDGLPTSPRPVLINTWEAVYFDHDLGRLRALADRAAAIGVERFVLDDGWFGSRRDDTKGLGDWWVSPEAHPDTLGPLIDHVTALGMDFGLWFEPEMVNPDSDLYRAHPEWVLGPHDVIGRNQLVLDLAIEACRDHLFEAIHHVLHNHAIAYVKWDHNRDVPPGHGHAQTLGFYALLDRLRAAHPSVEWESCASGGGRIDLAVLERAARVWTSDCNDAHDRQRIQRGYGHLFPLSAMGAHIGPPRAHTTGRTHRLAFRAATALFGHLGIEWNILDCTERDLDKLRAWLDLHKRFRPLVHGGDLVRLDVVDLDALSFGVVAPDRTAALFSYAQLDASRATMPPRWRLTGLDLDRVYRLEPLRMPGDVRGPQTRTPEWLDRQRDPLEVTGRVLSTVGVQLPVLLPESAFLLALGAV